MAVKTNQYGSRITQDTSRGPSQSIWADCPLEDFIQAYGGGIGTAGFVFRDDFLVAGNAATTNAIGNVGQWASWCDTSTIMGTDPQQEGGVVLLTDNASSGKNITLGTTAGGFGMITGATGFPLKQKLWFECRVAVGSITTAKRDAFVGLVDNTGGFSTASATAVIGSSNTLTTTPALFGFHFRATTNPTDVGLAYNVAGGTVQYPTGLQTLSNTVVGAALTAYAAVTNGNATGFIKLGFVFDPTPSLPAVPAPSSNNGHTQGTLYKPLITVFVNGQAAGEFLAANNVQASTFPATFMGPVLSYTSRSASSAGGLYVDWIQVAQLASF